MFKMDVGLEVTCNISCADADSFSLPGACGAWREQGSPESPVGGGGGHRAEAALTSAGRSIHESAVTPVVEEEVGPVLIVAEDIRGTAAEDGAHADAPAPWRGH